MSIPRAKTPSPDATDNVGCDAKICEKSGNSLMKKSIPILSTKSKISKQGKSLTPALEATDGTKNVKSDKPEENTSTSIRSTQSRSPEKASGPELKGKSLTSSGSVNNQKRIFETLYSRKKKQYITIARNIEDKQKLSVSTYEELCQLRDKILASGGKDPGRLEEPNLVSSSLTGWQEDQESRESAGAAGDEKQLVSQLEASLTAMPEAPLALCREALERRASLLAALLDLEQQDPSSFKAEVSRQLEACKLETGKFEERLESTRQEQLRQVNALMQRANSWWRDFQAQRQRDQQLVKSAVTPSGKGEEAAKELRAEKEKLAKARSKIREQEESLRQAQESIKQLESQLKQKDASIEQKVKELAKSQKNQETTLSKYEKQREAADAREKKLKEELEFKENESKTMISEYKKQIEDLERALENEKNMRQDLESLFEEFKTRNAKLEERCKQLLEMEEKRKEFISDDQHTDYEIHLFNDLKEARNLLKEKEEEIRRLHVEREKFIAAEDADEKSDSSKQRLVAELLKKSNELESLKSQYAQVEKMYKKTQQKSEHLDQKLLEIIRLQSHVKEGSRASYGAQVLQLQQRVTDLSSSLAESEAQKTELERTCTQQQLKLECYKRFMLNQDKDLKVRKEMYQLLHYKDVDGNLEHLDQNHYNSINVQEFKQLHEMLENKEMQVMKLEKLVKQMEHQESYSQGQRTRLENRIAVLELALKEAQQAHRNRGFSFL